MIPIGIGTAMFAHFIWNAGAGIFIGFFSTESAQVLYGAPLATIFLQLPFLIILLIAAFWMWSHESKIIDKYLRTESASIITESERTSLQPTIKRSLRNFFALFSGNWKSWRKQYGLRRLWIKLAFAKWHHSEDKEIDWPENQDKEIVSLREKIQLQRTQ